MKLPLELQGARPTSRNQKSCVRSFHHLMRQRRADHERRQFNRGNDFDHVVGRMKINCSAADSQIIREQPGCRGRQREDH